MPAAGAARDRDPHAVRAALEARDRSVARFPKLATVRRVTRTQRRPFLRSTVIVSIASRVVVTFTVAERLRALGLGRQRGDLGERAAVVRERVLLGHASEASAESSPSESAGAAACGRCRGVASRRPGVEASSTGQPSPFGSDREASVAASPSRRIRDCVVRVVVAVSHASPSRRRGRRVAPASAFRSHGPVGQLSTLSARAVRVVVETRRPSRRTLSGCSRSFGQRVGLRRSSRRRRWSSIDAGAGVEWRHWTHASALARRPEIDGLDGQPRFASP